MSTIPEAAYNTIQSQTIQMLQDVLDVLSRDPKSIALNTAQVALDAAYVVLELADKVEWEEETS